MLNKTAPNGVLHRLSVAEVAVWLDGLARDRLHDGGLASLVREGVVAGATTGPAAVQRALDTGIYQKQLGELAAAGTDGRGAVAAVMAADAREACDVLLPLFTSTGGVDGAVCIELPVGFAATGVEHLAGARRIRELVDRPNLLVGIPASAGGLAAITEALAAGIGVHAGPIFSAAQYRAVADAFLAGLEQAAERGLDLSEIPAVASFALSPVDTQVDKGLWAIGMNRAAALRGKAAVAGARMAYAAYEEVHADGRWAALESAGAKRRRLLWTATAAKDPYYSETIYVDNLVGPGVAYVMSEATMETVAESGRITGDTLHGTHRENARATMAEFERLGVDLADVARGVQNAQGEKSGASWRTLFDSVEAALSLCR